MFTQQPVVMVEGGGVTFVSSQSMLIGEIWLALKTFPYINSVNCFLSKLKWMFHSGEFSSKKFTKRKINSS